MSVSESDLELLESYVDDELPMVEADALWQRVQGDAGLAAALQTARSHRQARIEAFTQLEPDAEQNARFVAGVRRSIGRSRVLHTLRRGLTYATGAAACVLLGLALGRSGSTAPQPVTPANLVAPVNGTGDRVASSDTGNRQLQFVNPPVTPGRFPVYMQDSSGQVVSVQYFNTRDDAQQFINDIQRRSIQPTLPANRGVLPVNDERF